MPSYSVCKDLLAWDDDLNGLETLLPFRYRKHPASTSKLFTVPSDLGKGWIETFTFFDDFKMVVFHCRFRHGLEFQIMDRDWIRFNFSIAIKENMKFCMRESYRISGPSCRIINNHPGRKSTEIIPKDTSCIWVTIACKKSLLKKYFGKEMEKIFEKVFSKKLNGEPPCYLPFEMKKNIFNITQQVVYNHMDDATRIPYFEAKSLELLSLSINKFLAHAENDDATVILQDSELTKLKVIHNILCESLTGPPNVDELCSIVGMNRTKLRQEFKSVYGKTMQAFIQEKRLEYITELLAQGEYSMAEIAWLSGFKHQCNMTTHFKKKYGQTPREFRYKHQEASLQSN